MCGLSTCLRGATAHALRRLERPRFINPPARLLQGVSAASSTPGIYEWSRRKHLRTGFRVDASFLLLWGRNRGAQWPPRVARVCFTSSDTGEPSSEAAALHHTAPPQARHERLAMSGFRGSAVYRARRFNLRPPKDVRCRAPLPERLCHPLVFSGVTLLRLRGSSHIRGDGPSCPFLLVRRWAFPLLGRASYRAALFNFSEVSSISSFFHGLCLCCI